MYYLIILLDTVYTLEVNEDDNSSILTFDSDIGIESDTPCVLVVIKEETDYYIYVPVFEVDGKDDVLYIVTKEEHEKVGLLK